MNQKLYFTLDELNPRQHVLTQEQIINLTILIDKISVLRDNYGKPMKVTSGVRSMEDQMRINPKAPNSAHRTGEAVDILDDGSLKQFIANNLTLIEELDLYFEDFDHTPTWVHIQTRKPKSGNRFFKP